MLFRHINMVQLKFLSILFLSIPFYSIAFHSIQFYISLFSILFHAILFYSILSYFILFNSNLFNSIILCRPTALTNILLLLMTNLYVNYFKFKFVIIIIIFSIFWAIHKINRGWLNARYWKEMCLPSSK